MTYRELIKTKGYDWFSRIAKGWYCEDYVLGVGIDREVSRYGYLCDSPFYVINQLYNVAYEENESETGSMPVQVIRLTGWWHGTIRIPITIILRSVRLTRSEI